MRSTLLLLLACLSLAACGVPPAEPIRIGLAVNLSGRGGDAGEHIRAGALLAIDEINGQGGIAGRPLELLVRDDGNSDEGVANADRELLAAGVVAVIGHSQSANTLKAYPTVTGGGTVLLTAYTAANSLSGKDDLFLRTSVDCNLYGEKTGGLLTAAGVRSLVALLDESNQAFGEDFLASLRSHYRGSVTAVFFDSKTNPDWTVVTGRLLAPAPDAILLLTEATMTGFSAQKLRMAGYQGPLFASIWAQTPELFESGAGAVEGMAIVTFIDAVNGRPSYRVFAGKMEKHFHKPATARSARAYELVHILADALRRSGGAGGEQLKTALLAGRYDNLLGPVAFNRFGDVVRPVYEVVVEQGRFVTRREL
ncbi:MAG: ABC transporter substrate-binding protein [Thermodesulfobacteriota bacterium]